MGWNVRIRNLKLSVNDKQNKLYFSFKNWIIWVVLIQSLFYFLFVNFILYDLFFEMSFGYYLLDFFK